MLPVIVVAGGVVIGVGVEPQHEQLAPLLLKVARDAVDRAHRQRMIAAEKHRQRAGARHRVGAFARGANPALDFAVVFRVRGLRAVDEGEIAAQQVAVILHREAKAFEQHGEARGAQGRRPHQRALLRRADLDRHAEQRDASGIAVVSWSHDNLGRIWNRRDS